MKLRAQLIVFFLLICSITTFSQTTNPILDTLFQSSYKVFEMLRTPTGMYKKQLNLTSSNDSVSVSIGATGMGLMSLCIADSMKWIKNADSLALLTLKSLNGKTPGFVPTRNPAGYFTQLLNPVNGANAEASPYATLDNALLISGALFCKKYFKNDSITSYVDHLWKSINWSKSISNAYSGELFKTIDSTGTGAVTKPYTEYILVAWLAKSQECSNDQVGGPGRKLWTLFYGAPDSLPVKSTYKNIAVPTEAANTFLSESNYILPYYLCNYYANSVKYKTIMNNSRLQDSLWWAATKLTKPFETGTSSGVSYSSTYTVDAINNNKDSIVSPQALAGYFPVYSKTGANLTSLYKNYKGVYALPGNPDYKVLWRYSVLHPTWKAPLINAVDFASFLFGLAAMPKYLSKKFFLDNIDFFSPQAAFTANQTNFCSGACVDFFDKSIGTSLKYVWLFKGAEDTASTMQNPAHICYKAAGTYAAKLTVTNGCSSNVAQLPIVVKPNPADPIISQLTDTLHSTSARTYQWFYNGVPLTGETKQYYKAAQSGNYTVCITDTNACGSCSQPFTYEVTGVNELTSKNGLSMYPNPVHDQLEIKLPMITSSTMTLILTDALGRTVLNQTNQSGSTVQLDLNSLAPGIYCLHVSAQGFYQKEKIIKN